jgi:hypothetical protein
MTWLARGKATKMNTSYLANCASKTIYRRICIEEFVPTRTTSGNVGITISWVLPTA